MDANDKNLRISNEKGLGIDRKKKKNKRKN
jgi:hypothetical protein